MSQTLPAAATAHCCTIAGLLQVWWAANIIAIYYCHIILRLIIIIIDKVLFRKNINIIQVIHV